MIIFIVVWKVRRFFIVISRRALLSLFSGFLLWIKRKHLKLHFGFRLRPFFSLCFSAVFPLISALRLILNSRLPTGFVSP